MNIEELSKSQLILLTILVNFVMSVATGILTVSLLDEAPPVVTQTVNRVVEHTIERVTQQVAPAVAILAPAPSNQDLVTAALGMSASREVAIYAAQSGTSTPVVSIGTYLSKSRIVVTAAQEVLPKEALIEFSDGSYVPASLAHEGKGIVIYGFADKAVLPKVSSPILVAPNDLKLGQTALAISIEGSATTGIVARVSTTGVHTTLPDTGAGSATVDLSGNLIGVSPGGIPGFLIPADRISALLAATSTIATSTAATR